MPARQAIDVFDSLGPVTDDINNPENDHIFSKMATVVNDINMSLRKNSYSYNYGRKYGYGYARKYGYGYGYGYENEKGKC